ncbi:hypothetical protein LO82_03640 [Vibrio vulnificus]|nr:hypothetical protein LO82_03640 [Vibrio vulnificus]
MSMNRNSPIEGNVVFIKTNEMKNNVAYHLIKTLHDYPDTATAVIKKGRYQDFHYERVVKVMELLQDLIKQSGGDYRIYKPTIIREE